MESGINGWKPSLEEARLTKYDSRSDKRGIDLISDALPFGALWYGEPDATSNAIGYAKFRSRSHDAVTRVYDGAGNVIETHEHAGNFKEWLITLTCVSYSCIADCKKTEVKERMSDNWRNEGS